MTFNSLILGIWGRDIVRKFGKDRCNFGELGIEWKHIAVENSCNL